MPDLPPLAVQLLRNRGITDLAAATDFLNGRFAADDPLQLKGMVRAVERLEEAIGRGQRIAVYGDFDADGVTATALLVQVLGALGADVQPYIPHRVDEGYGLNLDALRRLYRAGIRVVVTVDCGIRSVAEVQKVGRHMDLIITDHHLPHGGEVPPAVAVINPRQEGCPYPFKDLAGVGLAYKLAQALLRTARGRGLPADYESGLLDLVAIGTVADLARLLGENRALVLRGLECLNDGQRPGVTALMADAGLRRGEVDAEAIGFRLGPRLNAAGRLESAMLAYQLLTGTDPLETKTLAARLGELNRERQLLTEETVAAAEAQVEAEQAGADLILVASSSFRAGVVGLAASRLTEAYYRPSVVVELGQDESRGSCRSIPEFHITDALDECRELLIRHGGHRAAAGFTVATANLEALRHRLQAIAAEQLAGVERRPMLAIDAEVPLDQVDWPIYEQVQHMQPCGQGNPSPVLLSRGVPVRDRRPMGISGQHLKLLLGFPAGVAWDAILFRGGPLLDEVPDVADVAYCLAVNDWNGERRLQLEIQDLQSV